MLLERLQNYIPCMSSALGLNNTGQLSPQSLEDLPLSLMVFLVSIAIVLFLFVLSTNHISTTDIDDLHNTGKRLVETLTSEVFVSPLSRSYGAMVLDGDEISRLHLLDPTLENTTGPIEYNFWVLVRGDKSWEFGDPPKRRVLTYGTPVTILSHNSLYNGEVVVKIWR